MFERPNGSWNSSSCAKKEPECSFQGTIFCTKNDWPPHSGSFCRINVLCYSIVCESGIFLYRFCGPYNSSNRYVYQKVSVMFIMDKGRTCVFLVFMRNYWLLVVTSGYCVIFFDCIALRWLMKVKKGFTKEKSETSEKNRRMNIITKLCVYETIKRIFKIPILKHLIKCSINAKFGNFLWNIKYYILNTLY